MIRKFTIAKACLIFLLFAIMVIGINCYKGRKAVVDMKKLYKKIMTVSNEGAQRDEEKIKSMAYKIINMNKKRILNHTILGFAHYMLDENDKAFSLLEKAVELEPHDSLAFTLLGHIYREKGNYDKALDMVDIAYKYKNSETLPFILKAYGLIYDSSNNPVKACEYYQKALDLDSRRQDLYECLVLNYAGKIKNYTTTVEICNKGLSIYPDNWILLLYLGLVYTELNKTNEAVSVLEKALEKTKELNSDIAIEGQVYILKILGVAYTQLGNFEKAKECILNAKKIKPDLKSGTILSQLALLDDLGNSAQLEVLNLENLLVPGKIEESDKKEMLERTRLSVVIISVGAGHGSGFVISEDGYLLTAAHVVGEAKSIKVKFITAKQVRGEVIHVDKFRDIAIVKLEKGNYPYTILGNSSDIEVGENVFAIGAPLTEELSHTVTQGIVSSFRTINGIKYIQSDVGVHSGNSGGPLVSVEKGVIGICVSGVSFGPITLGLNLFAPIEEVKKSLQIRQNTVMSKKIDEPQYKDLKVEGIFIDANAKNSVLISGRIFHEDDIVGNGKIQKINEDSVEIFFDSEKKVFRVGDTLMRERLTPEEKEKLQKKKDKLLNDAEKIRTYLETASAYFHPVAMVVHDFINGNTDRRFATEKITTLKIKFINQSEDITKEVEDLVIFKQIMLRYFDLAIGTIGNIDIDPKKAMELTLELGDLQKKIERELTRLKYKYFINF